MADKKKLLLGSPFGRSRKLLKAGVSMATREVRDRLLRISDQDSVLGRRLAQSREFVDALRELRGAAMKAGQMISLELSDLLPKEVVEVLRELHDEAQTSPFEDIKEIVCSEIGEEKWQALESFSPEPLAAGSIAQVHAARYRGKAVAVKVQYPGIRDSIDADLKVVRRIAHLVLRLQGKQEIPLDAMFQEVAKQLKYETDFRKEASKLKAYRNVFGDDDGFVIPDVFEDLSSERVLTLSLEEGEKLKDFLASRPPQQARDRLYDLFLSLIIKEFFAYGMVQTDPHHGNFLVDRRGPRLVLLDFGATQKFPKTVRQNIIRLGKAILSDDWETAEKVSVRLELLDHRESEQTKGLYWELLRSIGDMFREENQPFHFGDKDYIRRIREQGYAFIKAVQYTPPPRRYIFLNRKLGGIYHILKDEQCILNLNHYWQKIVGTDVL